MHPHHSSVPLAHRGGGLSRREQPLVPVVLCLRLLPAMLALRLLIQTHACQAHNLLAVSARLAPKARTQASVQPPAQPVLRTSPRLQLVPFKRIAAAQGSAKQETIGILSTLFARHVPRIHTAQAQEPHL